MPAYGLVITAQGSLSGSVSSFIASVASAVGLLPGYTHISTDVQQQNGTAIITTRYVKDTPEVDISSLGVPVVVYSVLAVIAIFGLLTLSYYWIEVAPATAGGTIMLFVIGAIAAAYLISKMRE